MEENQDIKNLITEISITEGDGFNYQEEIIKKDLLLNEDQPGLLIKVISILGGFWACITFFGFLMLAGLYESENGMIIIGAIFYIAVIIGNRYIKNIVLDTASVSTYLVAIGLIGFALIQREVELNYVFIIMILLAVITVIVTESKVLNFIAILIFSGHIQALIIYNEANNLLHVYNIVYVGFTTFVLMNEAKIISFSKKMNELYSPLRIGLLFSLVGGFVFLGVKGIFDTEIAYVWVTSGVIVLLVLYFVYKVIISLKINNSKTRLALLISSALILLPSIFAPAICGAVLIILLTYHQKYKTGLGLGIISLIYFIIQFYYDLELKLIEKSIILFLSGVLFIVAYVFIKRILLKGDHSDIKS